MKIRVIRIFFGAYLAICITYGALRTVIMPPVTDDNVNSPKSIEETAETVMLETEETGSTTTGLTQRDLNYDKYFKEGSVERAKLTEFNSNNTTILNVEQVKEKLMSISYVRDELAEWENRQ